jgi:hypothetical protein
MLRIRIGRESRCVEIDCNSLVFGAQPMNTTAGDAGESPNGYQSGITEDFPWR